MSNVLSAFSVVDDKLFAAFEHCNKMSARHIFGRACIVEPPPGVLVNYNRLLGRCHCSGHLIIDSVSLPDFPQDLPEAKLPSELSISLLLYSGIFVTFTPADGATDSIKRMRSCQTGFCGL
jgi:hypothetical protein